MATKEIPFKAAEDALVQQLSEVVETQFVEEIVFSDGRNVVMNLKELDDRAETTTDASSSSSSSAGPLFASCTATLRRKTQAHKHTHTSTHKYTCSGTL